MAPTLTLVPNPIAPGGNVRVNGAGFDPSKKVQLALDGSGWTTNYFRPADDGSFHVGVNVSTKPKTQSLTARYAGSSAIVATAPLTVAVIVPPPVDPPPVTPPPTGKVVQFGTGARTPAALAALAADTTIDVIEWVGGEYLWQEAYLNVARPSTRPLRVQPAPGAAILWDGGGSASPAFRIGWNSVAQPEVKASYITIDAAGTGGSFTAHNYRLSLDGLVQARYYDHIAVNGVIVRDVYGTGTPQTVHSVYLDHVDGLAGHRGQYWTSNNWDVVGPSSRVLCGFQIDHTPSHDHATAAGWTVENLHRWSYLWSDPTDVVIDGWTGKNCNVTIDNYPNNAYGVVKNCHATNCGPLAPGKGSWVAGKLVDGGGNTYS